jgi:hypothetical protein
MIKNNGTNNNLSDISGKGYTTTKPLPTLDYSTKLKLKNCANDLVNQGIKICATWGKAPKYSKWQNGITLEQYDQYISSGATGLGLITGGDYVAVDVDGPSADLLLNQILTRKINTLTTLTWTSGKKGRYQLLYKRPTNLGFNPKSTKKPTGDDELLEIRYENCQSVLPPSWHPETGEYKWVNYIGNTR